MLCFLICFVVFSSGCFDVTVTWSNQGCVSCLCQWGFLTLIAVHNISQWSRNACADQLFTFSSHSNGLPLLYNICWDARHQIHCWQPSNCHARRLRAANIRLGKFLVSLHAFTIGGNYEGQADRPSSVVGDVLLAVFVRYGSNLHTSRAAHYKLSHFNTIANYS